MPANGTPSPASGAEYEQEQNGRIPRACDNCFKKKVKCDKKSPCSSCRASNIACSTAARKPKERRQRVLISSQYERKIDRLDDRLASIEASLRGLLSGTPTPDSTRKASFWSGCGGVDSPDSPDSSGCDSESSSRSRSGTAFEGDSALSAHTTRAGQLFEETLHKQAAAADEQTPEMTAAFTSLRSLLTAQSQPLTRHDLRFPGQKDRPRGCPMDCEMPPAPVVLAMLKAGKGNPPCYFVKFPVLHFCEFAELCQKVYFPTDSYSLAQLTLVNGGLCYWFWERISSTEDAALKAEYQRYADLCCSNFETCLSSFQLLTQPTLENVQSLLLGAVHATKLSRPSMCWIYISTAAQMCLTLGYHRMTPDQDRYRIKARLFWFVYTLERGFALKLGRAPTIPDYDVTVDVPEISQDPTRKPWDTLHAYWVEMSKIQGRLYTGLYSASGVRESAEVRAERAWGLVAEIQALQEKYGQDPTTVKDAFFGSYLQFELEFDKVAYYALLTLIYQTVPPVRSASDPAAVYSPECVDAARKCLQYHREMFLKFGHETDGLWRGYIEWCILYQPFTPCLVVFCQAVTTLDVADLESLQDVLASLQAAAQLSEGAARLHHVCSVLFRVAKVYIEEKLSTAKVRASLEPMGGSGAGQAQGDGQLNFLGFDLGPFGMDSYGLENGRGVEEGMALDYVLPAPLGDWMPTEQDMMGLLDTDMGDLGFFQWKRPPAASAAADGL